MPDWDWGHPTDAPLSMPTSGIKKTAELLAVELDDAITAGAMGIAAALQAEIAPYPYPPPLSTYMRTGQDQQGWHIRPQSMGATLENRVAYTRYLHGSPGRTRVHTRTGWTDEDEAKKQVIDSGEANEIMQQAITNKLEATQ